MSVEDDRYPIQQTSLDAFESVRNYKGTWQQKALALLKIKPLTCEEVETILQAINPNDGKHQSISSAFTRLSQRGLVVDTGTTRRTKSQSPATVWRLPYEGEEVILPKASRPRAAILKELEAVREDMALIVSACMQDGGYFERLAKVHVIAAKWSA